MEPKDIQEGGSGSGTGISGVDKSAAAEQAAAQLPKANLLLTFWLFY